MKQGSKEWHDWRNNGIGGSDAPVIMEVSPYKTLHELWLEKTGQQKKEIRNDFILEKGHEAEEIARRLFIKQFKQPIHPKCITHEKIPFLRASLDGYFEGVDSSNEFLQPYIVEIKMVGKDVFERGEIPNHYYPQIQHQHFVAGCQKGYFVLFNFEANAIKVIESKADKPFLFEYLKKAREFWHSVLMNVEPELAAKDYKSITDLETCEMARVYEDVCRNIEVLERAKKELKEKIVARCDHPKVLVENLRIIKSTRKGTVNYKKIPELKSVNLDAYRGADVTSTSIAILKKGD